MFYFVLNEVFTSRKEVDLVRTFKFYHSPKVWSGVPIMTANMATCGTFEMARTLAPYKIITTFHKYYEVEDYVEFFKLFSSQIMSCIPWAQEMKISKSSNKCLTLIYSSIFLLFV